MTTPLTLYERITILLDELRESPVPSDDLIGGFLRAWSRHGDRPARQYLDAVIDARHTRRIIADADAKQIRQIFSVASAYQVRQFIAAADAEQNERICDAMNIPRER